MELLIKEFAFATMICATILLRNTTATICDGQTVVEVREPQGSLTIPDDAMVLSRGVYKHNQHCRWKITATEGWAVHLRFTSFHLENPFIDFWCVYDYVYLLDPESNEEWELCGHMTDIPEIRTAANVLEISFVSDGSLDWPGFSATYYTVVLPTTTSPPTPATTILTTPTTTSSMTTASISSAMPDATTTPPAPTSTTVPTITPVSITSVCASRIWYRELIGSAGTISSPTGRYEDQQNCTWTIRVLTGKVVRLSVIRMDIEPQTFCGYDALSVYDGPTIASTRAARFCGAALPPEVVSTGAVVTMTFVTDGSVTATGFTAVWQTTEQRIRTCIGRQDLSGRSGNLTTGSDVPYAHNAVCSWVIRVPVHKIIELEFEYVDVEFHASCRYDVLTVYDGETEIGTPIIRICGTYTNLHVRSTKNVVLVTFTSDYSIAGRGFRATYRSTPGDIYTTPPPAWSERCGRRSGAGPLRIVGGTEAQRHSWPWQVSIQHRNRYHFCGGTIIGARWVVTAAHCMRNLGPQQILLRVGVHDLYAVGDGYEVYVSRIHNYPEFDSQSTRNDISLLELATELDFSSDVYPACLSTSEALPPEPCVVTGWGYLQEGGPASPSVLYEAEVPVVENVDCAVFYSSLLPSMVCAGYSNGGPDTCQGDSGGPLICKRPGSDVHVIHGITSFGIGCGRRYGVYARISSFLSWINETMALFQ